MGCWVEVLVEFLCGDREVLVADNVVPVEHAARFVSADSHRNNLWDTGPDEVSDARPSEVVEEPRRLPVGSREAGVLARVPPRGVHALDLFSVATKDPRGKWPVLIVLPAQRG